MQKKILSQIRIFPGWFEKLAAIGEFVTHAAEVAGFDARNVYAVQMAVDEACSNIIEHAYGGEGRGDIECTCQVDETGLTVILRDQGEPFNPDRVPLPNLNASLDERDECGLGLYFLQQLMDETHFSFTLDSGNVLTMVKRRDPETST